MVSQHHKKKTIALFVVWNISGLAFTAFNKYSQTFKGTYLPSTQVSVSILITILATVLYFIPLLIVIRHRAKTAPLKWLIIATGILLFLISVALTVFVITLLCSLL